MTYRSVLFWQDTELMAYIRGQYIVCLRLTLTYEKEKEI